MCHEYAATDHSKKALFFPESECLVRRKSHRTKQSAPTMFARLKSQLVSPVFDLDQPVTRVWESEVVERFASVGGT
jgi:hypothetical protein